MKNLVGISEFKYIKSLCLVSIVLETGLAVILGILYYLYLSVFHWNFSHGRNSAISVWIILLPLNILMQFCLCALYCLVLSEVQKYWKLLVIFFYFNIIRIFLIIVTIFYFQQNPLYYIFPVVFLIFNIFLFFGIYREGFIRRQSTI